MIFFTLLTGIFASCNVFLRLPFLYKLSTIPLLVGVMFPLVAQFALPLSSSLAVYVTVTSHKMHDQLLTLSYLRQGRLALYKAIIIFSFLCTGVYSLLVFQFTPQSYKLGKKLLIQVAKEHILQLESNKFHAPFPRFNFFFKEKINDNTFGKLLLAFISKENEERYVFTAQKGVFDNNQMFLRNGSICTLKKGTFHLATFDQTIIDIGSVVESKKEEESLSQSKFMTGKQLVKVMSKNNNLFVEFLKRIALVLWQLLFPIAALIFSLFFSYESLLSGLIFCGVMYLASYVLLMLGQVYAHSLALSLSIFYLPLLIILIVGLFLLKKQQ